MATKGYGKSQTGTKKAHNDDAFLADPELGLFMVCDGVSGNHGGNIASGAAIAIVKKRILDGKADVDACATDPGPAERKKVTQLITEAVAAASAQIHDEAHADPKLHGMATTCEVLLIAGRFAFLAHVGDSRIYLYRSDKLHALTVDHNYVNELVTSYGKTVEDAKRHYQAHALTRALGVNRHVMADTLEIELLPNDRFLMCSDGLDRVSAEDLARLLKGTPANGAADNLILLAAQKGARDDITAVVIDCIPVITEEQSKSALQKIETVKTVPLFKYFQYPELVALLEIGTLRTLPAGQTVLKDGVRGTELLIVVEGSVRITKHGREVAKHGPGSFLGEMSMVEQLPSSADVLTADACSLIVFQLDELQTLFNKSSGLAVKFLWALSQTLSQRLRATTAELAGAREPRDPPVRVTR